jgi:hypothetical protein
MAYMLSNIIDEDVYILHLAEQKGYKCRVSGCADNKMLGKKQSILYLVFQHCSF